VTGFNLSTAALHAAVRRVRHNLKFPTDCDLSPNQVSAESDQTA
jgi:hypothetical protein